MLEEVTSDTLTEVGAADGATKHRYTGIMLVVLLAAMGY